MQDTRQRRRADDFTAHQHDETTDLYPGKDRRRSSPAGRRPSASFLRKFRQPIIGLTMAGAAAPLIHAGTAHEKSAAPAHEGSPTEADLARQAQAKGVDAEDQLADRIAAESTSQTTPVVDAAVSTYKIDEGLAKDIYNAAQEAGIEPKLAYGLVHTESSFDTHAKSGVGARGLTQVMPKTAKWLQPGTKPDDLWDQKTNLKLGFRYLNQLIDKYHGNVRHALTAYNRGPGTVDRILKRGGDPDNGYAGKVIGGSKFGT